MNVKCLKSFTRFIQAIIIVGSFGLLLLLPGISSAEHVSKEYARQAANVFLSSQVLTPLITPSGNEAKVIPTGHTIEGIKEIRKSDGTVLAYIVELSPEGYIITSADDKLRPVLGYSFTGTFSFEDTPKNVLLHLIKWDVEARLKAFDQPGIGANKIINKAESYKTPYQAQAVTQWGPWLKTQWSQDGHFNNKTPYKDLSSIIKTRRPVGCTATAMAQILNYWKYPSYVYFNSDKWPAGDRYETSTDKIQIDGDADTYGFPTFSELNNNLSVINYDGDNEEEANLCFAVGIKLRMDYGKGGSGANLSDFAYRNGFSYGSAGYDSGYNVWLRKQEKVIDNIKKGWPVQIAIIKAGDIFGHSVVVDGYKTAGEFHLNMGWGGSDDNWYFLPIVGRYDTICQIVYDIAKYSGWPQYGADEKNSFKTEYDAPLDNKNKWKVTCPVDYSFSDIVVGINNKIYAACSPRGVYQHPFIYIMNQFGDRKKQFEIYTNQKIEYLAQHDRYVFASTELGEIYRIDTIDDSINKIFTEPNGHNLYRIKIDKEGYLYVYSDYNLYRLSSSGSTCWTFQVPSGSVMGTRRTTPAIDSDRNSVYITYYNSSTDTAYLAKLNQQSGVMVATRTFPSIPFLIFQPASIASDGTIYLPIYDKLYALNPDNISGAPLWSKNIYIKHVPVIGEDGSVYIAYWEEINGTWYEKLASLNPSNGSEKYSISFQLDINTDDIFQPYIAGNGVIAFTIESSGPVYTVNAYKDTGSGFTSLWNYYAGTSGGNFAFGPGATLYMWGETGLANALYAISEGNVGDPYGIAMDFTDNKAPEMPSNPTPLDGATDVETDVTLSWTSFDPDGQSLKYDVYLCASIEGEERAFIPVANGISTNSYNITDLRAGVSYSWTVRATDGQTITEGPIWSFSTAPIPEPDITVTDSVAPIDDLYIPFGNITVGSTSDQTITITNDGNAQLKIDDIPLSGSSDFSVIPPTSFPIYIDASDSTTVTVRFTPSSANGKDATLTINSNDPDEAKVLVRVSGTGIVIRYTLTIGSGTGGTTDPSPGTYIHDTGTQVIIRAMPDSGYTFSGWSGDASGTTNPITITMDRDKSITANFIRQYTLTIASGTGGTTSPSPGTYTHDSGAQVSITATANSGYQFSGWSGSASGTTNPITITMDNDKSVTANFTATAKSTEEGKKGGCFITTAAYGSPLHPHVKILRDFRDKYLISGKFGRKLVDLYYKYSPFVADLIRKNKALKIATRINLLPIVAFSYSAVRYGLIITAVLLIIIFMLPVFIIYFFRTKLRWAEAKY